MDRRVNSLSQNPLSAPSISVVSPVYRGEKSVPQLVDECEAALQELTDEYEIILVDDRSPDASWQVIEEICARRPAVKGVRLSKNYGQHFAITAGIDHSQGDYTIVLDCDLQDDPQYFKDLLSRAQEGYDIVFTRKQSRKHSLFKNITAKMFSAVFNRVIESQDVKYDTSIGAYSLLSRKVVDAFKRVKDSHRHYLLVLFWLGFRSSEISVIHRPRKYGQSNYTFWKLVNHAVDGIISHSEFFLRLSVGLGFYFCLMAFTAIAGLVVSYFLWDYREGWTSVFVLILFCTGVMLMCLGVVGIYVGKIFEQVKDRPLYLVAESLNQDVQMGKRSRPLKLA